jgi:hypothetical protein
MKCCVYRVPVLVYWYLYKLNECTVPVVALTVPAFTFFLNTDIFVSS